MKGKFIPIKGEINYGDQSIHSLSPRELATQISLVLTEKPSSLNLTVIELIALGRHPYSNWLGVLGNEDKKVIERVISETNINYIANHKLYELSDGQLQISMIARALAQETDLIILDEPTAHLDLHNKIEVMKLLKKIAGQDKSVLISTHDIQIGTQLSDQFWLFNFNSQINIGVPEDLILSGAIHQTLFLDEDTYDLKHGTINMKSHGPSIVVEGVEETRFWTEHALKRKGYQIDKNSDHKIQCNNNKKWIVKLGNKTSSHSSLGQVLNKLGQLSNLN